MPQTLAVVVTGDPRQSTAGVEALRIALGLSTGDNSVSIILLGAATRLLTDDEDLSDGDILEQYLPSLKELQIPFVVPLSTLTQVPVDSGFNVREAPHEDITRLIHTADRTLVF